MGQTEVPQAGQLLQTFPHLRYVVEGQVCNETESTAVTSMLHGAMCRPPTEPFQVDQSLQSLDLLNDVVVQLQFPQTRELPQVLDVQDVCRRQVLGCRSN